MFFVQIIPDGILAFSRPEWIQPPYTFPNPKWPERRDASFIAPFFAYATYQYVGETGISHVWYRTVHRPKLDEQTNFVQGQPLSPASPQGIFSPFGPNFQNYPGRKVQPGYVDDPELLDNITRDIQNAIVGAQGFTVKTKKPLD